MSKSVSPGFQVGGVHQPRPFRVRRLGHFQYFARDMRASLDFYTRLLGFKITDQVDFSARLKSDEMRARAGDPKIYFMRYGADHHSFILSSPILLEVIHGAPPEPAPVIGQITWQVGSLREVADGHEWFKSRGRHILRFGRDTPGSNWHTYFPDPDAHPNELYYGIEQIGWDGRSKPISMHGSGHRVLPPLPYKPEYEEVAEANAAGIDLGSGVCSLETAPALYEVDGIKLPRPFKIVGIGPLRLFVENVQKSLDFYVDELGLRLTETVTWEGHDCYFLRANTEHHAIALYPEALRDHLNLPGSNPTLSFGVRLHGYRQLTDAIDFLRREGVVIRYMPPQLSPGMNYTAFAVDPSGYLIQLYCDMEQIGWDGKPRPAEARLKIDNHNWPDALPENDDTFCGEPFLGPWA